MGARRLGLPRFVLLVAKQLIPGMRSSDFREIRSFFVNQIGLEIGGPSRIFRPGGMFPVYEVAKRVDNTNFSSRTLWEERVDEGRAFKFHDQKPYGNQFISEASDLRVPDAMYGFVISSHMLEHSANPIRVLYEWTRVLRIDGVLLIVIPHKQTSFDRKRPLTSLGHLVDDYLHNTGEEDCTHFQEFVSLHDTIMDSGFRNWPEFIQRVNDNVTYRLVHHHVFATSTAIQILDYVGLRIVTVLTTLPGIVVIGRKTADIQQAHRYNRLYLSDDARWRKTSIFSLDRRE